MSLFLSLCCAKGTYIFRRHHFPAIFFLCLFATEKVHLYQTTKKNSTSNFDFLGFYFKQFFLHIVVVAFFSSPPRFNHFKPFLFVNFSACKNYAAGEWNGREKVTLHESEYSRYADKLAHVDIFIIHLCIRCYLIVLLLIHLMETE